MASRTVTAAGHLHHAPDHVELAATDLDATATATSGGPLALRFSADPRGSELGVRSEA